MKDPITLNGVPQNIKGPSNVQPMIIALTLRSHLKSLVRIKYGPFTVNDSLPPSKIRDILEKGRLEETICPLDSALMHLPAIYVSSESGESLRNGRAISLEDGSVGKEIIQKKPYRAYVKDGCFIGLVKAEPESDYLKPLKVFS